MDVKQSFKLAIKSLLTSKIRAVLTMLGIIIGVAAVIIIISLGNGMQKMMLDEFESMGSNLLMVFITGESSSRNITVDEMYEFAEENSDTIATVSPNVKVLGSIKHGTKTYTPSIIGVGETFNDIKGYKLTQGRFIDYIDISRRVNACVVGSYIETNLFNGNAYGKTLKINGNEYKIIGVLEKKADSTEGSDDDIIIIPYSNALKLNKTSKVAEFDFSAKTSETATAARTAIEEKLYKVYKDKDSYNILSMSELLDSITKLQNTLVAIIAAIAGISLLVGGIGIMNIMLVSVTERTREIGIRKSLGAKRKDIRMQFLIEAGTTSLLGGIIGILLGCIGSIIAGTLLKMSALPSIPAIIIASGISFGIGILFGYLPANKAAMLNPIDALRYE